MIGNAIQGGNPEAEVARKAGRYSGYPATAVSEMLKELVIGIPSGSCTIDLCRLD